MKHFIFFTLICSLFKLSYSHCQSIQKQDLDSTRFYFSIGMTPHWNKPYVYDVKGSVSQVRGWATTGFVADFGFSYFAKKYIYHLNFGHGVYNDGFYFKYDYLDHPILPYNSLVGFEKNMPLHYSSLKLSIANNFKSQTKKKLKLKIHAGIDIRMNWGYKIFYDDSRNDISHTSNQEFFPNTDSTLIIGWRQSASTIQRNISVNPILGFDYYFGLKNKTFLSLGIVYSVPFLNIIQSSVALYPDLDTVKSSFKSRYNGGYLGIRAVYTVPMK